MARKTNLYAMQNDSRYVTADMIKKQEAKDAADAQRIRNQAASNKGNYDFTAYGGNTNAYVNAMKNAGFTWNGNKGSNFSLANDPLVTPSYNSNVDSVRAKYGSFGGGGSIGYTQGFKPSQAYLDAMSYTQGLLDKINSGRTSYSDKVDAMMDKIANREKFSYDFNTDPLFQNMLGSAMAAGQTAMQDTMGQAAALTGGYGSSYAQSVGNQAYNNYVKGAYDQLPEFYNAALQAYQMEGNELYRQLDMYNTADDKEYGRLTTAYGLNYQQAQDQYNREATNFWNTENFNQEADKFNAQQSLANAKFKYQQYQDELSRIDALNAQTAKTASASATASEDTGAKESTIKNIKTEGKSIIENLGYGTNGYDEWLMQMANNYGMSSEQIREIDTYLKSYAPKGIKRGAELGAYNGVLY